MKKLLATILILCSFAISVYASNVSLPNYRDEGTIVVIITCDNSTTVYTKYVTDKYVVVVVQVKSGDTFYVFGNSNSRFFFFKKRNSSEATEISIEKFEERISAEAPQFVAKAKNNDPNTDCSISEYRYKKK